MTPQPINQTRIELPLGIFNLKHKTKTILLEKSDKIRSIETALDVVLQVDEVLLKVHRTCICGTDIHAYFGRQPFFSYPRIIGHKMVPK